MASPDTRVPAEVRLPDRHPVCLDTLIHELSLRIGAPRSVATSAPYLESIIDKARLPEGISPAEPEPLLCEVIGFSPETLPMIDHTCAMELGNLTERLIETALQAAYGDHLVGETEAHRRFGARAEELALTYKGTHAKKAIRWKAPDFVLGNLAIEAKYSFGSSQTAGEQRRVASLYRALGLVPVFLHIAPHATKRETLEAGGWHVLAGADAYAFASELIGTDFTAALRAAARDPALSVRRASAHAARTECAIEAVAGYLRAMPSAMRADVAVLAAAPQEAAPGGTARPGAHAPPGHAPPSEGPLPPAPAFPGAGSQPEPSKRVEDIRATIVEMFATLDSDCQASVLDTLMGSASEESQLEIIANWA